MERAALSGHTVADLLRAVAGDRPQPADLPRSARSARGTEMVEAHGRALHHAGGDGGDRNRDRARLRIRSALPRLPLRLADDGGRAVRNIDAEPSADRRASD